VYRNVMEAAEDEAHKLGLPVAHHAGVEETNAWDDIKFGTRSIEHWYGIPDAAIPDGVQNFPASLTTTTTKRTVSVTRATYGATPIPKRLTEVLTAMVKANVAWVPTLDIYEASRDLERAQNQVWFKEYLHPTLEEFFRPNPKNHGSYFLGWTSNDEVFWKENYRIWMSALREFDHLGGTIGSGDDAGFIYQIYGFGLLRELGVRRRSRLQSDQGDSARHRKQRAHFGHGRQDWQRARRVHGRFDCGERQSAREHERCCIHKLSPGKRRVLSGPSKTAMCTMRQH
jgi:hypothetical protein